MIVSCFSFFSPDRENAFSSIVLRPGMNIQIRTGYGNNAEMLEVKLSGRITDVNKSANGELIEIIAQSFGVELEQQLKSLDAGDTRTFDMTHKLLGALMFEAELKHFGRWEKQTTGCILRFHLDVDKSIY